MKSTFRNYTFFARVIFIVVLLSAPSLTHAIERRQNNPETFSARTDSPVIQGILADETGIRFELNTAPYSFAEDGSIQLAGLEAIISEVGSPALPYYSTLIALPPKANVTIQVDESEIATTHYVNVLPVAQDQLWGKEAAENDIFAYDGGSIREQSPLVEENSSIYSLDAAFPGVTNSVSEPMYMRDLRMVELRLYPLQYNPYHHTLTQASKLSVEISFSGADLGSLRPSATDREVQENVWREKVINYDQALGWRSLPQDAAASNVVKLPIGTKTYKIEVNQDGIYEIPGSDLAAKGMALPINPQTIQMIQAGNSVAYQFVDTNNNQQFDAVDKIRFYGWAFDGPRTDKNYVGNNIFWLWAGGNASHLTSVSNQAGTGPVITSFRESITEWQENNFSSGWSIAWDVNEPTLWHTRRVWINSGEGEHIESIDLPNPDPNGANPSYLVELSTLLRRPLSGSSTTSFEVQTYLNGSAQFGESSWIGPKNLNVVKTVNKEWLLQPGDAGYPANQLKVKLQSNSVAPIRMDLTRFTVNYTRQLVAVGDQLIFGRSAAGPSSFKISGFSNGDPNKAIVWDISDAHLPKQIVMNQGNIAGGGTSHIYLVGRNHSPNARFIATTNNNFLKVKALSEYVPVTIDPPSGGARWLAITHSSLRGAANELAAYRQSQMSAYVVNIENVVNQTGYGFNTPETIRQYLRHAINDWTRVPDYVTLIGDATNNPRNLDCANCSSSWTKDTPTLIVTDLKFVDRWQGMIPSDFAISLLFGDDLLPDIAIARLPAYTNQEALAMVRKVINYETQREDSPNEWQEKILFVADNPDTGGNFCVENANAGALIPNEYNQTHLCLVTPTVAMINKLRADMSKQINDIGLSIMNYRGHGSTNRWAGYNNEPPILDSDDVDFWQNSGRSVIVLSADCLDGYFIQNHQEALGETFIRLNRRGTAAHWSSSGLGYSSEHSVLHKGFYEGIFQYGQVAIGDAVNYAKIKYHQSAKHPSELYSFILLGDAAMGVVPNTQSHLFMPVIVAR